MNENRLKVMVILGTRPEIIRLARVISALADVTNLKLVHTGQNYDYELNEVFFEEFGIPRPDYFLEAAAETPGETVGAIIARSEKVMISERPDAVVILGDTNSALSAYSATRLQIPVYHMEAGNRCFDRNVPEETNRKLVDHISDFNLAYTEHGRRNLLAEGLHPRRVYVTGSPMNEVLSHYRERIECSTVLDSLGIQHRRYLLASLHREENVDNEQRLGSLVQTLNALADEYEIPVVVSTHPRTRKRLEQMGADVSGGHVKWLKPFGFFDYNRLQMSALCVISDSGTIAEEASILKFAAVTPRASIERPEAMDTGTIIVCGNATENILSAVRTAIASLNFESRQKSDDLWPADYRVTNTSQRVVNLIVGTAKLSNAWDGIETRAVKSQC